MVSWLWAGCVARGPMPDTIDGLQVIAITANPPEPAPEDAVSLEVWVADGLRRGADVLVWSCTPIDGTCAEALPPGTDGLPFPFWAKTATVPVDGDPRARVSVGWPLFATFANAFGVDDVALGVWALACAPGVCPLVDAVKANPVPGSEAWTETASDLATPDEWIGDFPREQVSLAAKVLPIYTTDLTGTFVAPNTNPTVVEVAAAENVTSFEVVDVDNDGLSSRSFVTAGGVDQRWTTDTVLTVTWHEPASPLAVQDRFVVVEDGQGGTAAWSNRLDNTADPCGEPRILQITQGGTPVLPGDPLQMIELGAGVYVPLELTVSSEAPTFLGVEVVDDTSFLGRLDDYVVPAPTGLCQATVSLQVQIGPPLASTEWMCTVAGSSVTLELTWGEGGTVQSQPVVLTLPPEAVCLP